MDLLIRDLYSRNKDINDFSALVTAHFQQKYSSENLFNKIPTIFDDVSLQAGSIVSFNAMVQDTSFSSELYLAKTASGDCGGWGLNTAATEIVHYTDLKECTVFWAVSIPGLSPWCTAAKGPNSFSRPSLPHKYPISGAPHIGVQLKIYDEALAKPLRATNTVCFVGIITSEPLHSNVDVQSEPLNVPTLHVLFTKPLTTTVVPRAFPDVSILPTIKQLRNELIQWIANEALDGDLIAAEWILLTTLARVQSRTPSILPLTLTLSGFPEPIDGLDSTPTLNHVLALIFPLVTTLPLSLDVLNKTSFCPESRDEDLHSGWLQVPRGSILILTESSIVEGSIVEKGVMNIRAVQEMMKTQSLDYLFPFSSFQFETDVNFVVVTSGKQSTFFKTDLNIPIVLKSSISEAKSRLYKPSTEISLPAADKLAQFRQLVGGAKVGSVRVGDVTRKHVEDDFVKERSEKNSPTEQTFTSDDLIQHILVSRMVALSFHEPEVTIDIWEHAKKLAKTK